MSTYRFEPRDQTRVRYKYKGETQEGCWDSAREEVLYLAEGGYQRDSLNQFAFKHIKRVNAEARNSVDAWRLCEFKIDGIWTRSQLRMKDSNSHNNINILTREEDNTFNELVREAEHSLTRLQDAAVLVNFASNATNNTQQTAGRLVGRHPEQERVLPREWMVHPYIRKSGNQEGKKYYIYEAPDGRKYRSKKQAEEAGYEEIVWSGGGR